MGSIRPHFKLKMAVFRTHCVVDLMHNLPHPEVRAPGLAFGKPEDRLREPRRTQENRKSEALENFETRPVSSYLWAVNGRQE